MFYALGGISIVAVVSILLFAGAQPDGYLTVSEAISGPYLFKTVKVRGDVVDWNSKTHSFSLTDNASKLGVDYSRVPGGAPPSFTTGKHVVVKGLLKPGLLEAEEITVGCPTDYKGG